VNQALFAALEPAPLRGRGIGKFANSLVGQALPRAPLGQIRRHLILGYRPGWQSIGDLQRIADHVTELDPSIRTFIVKTTYLSGVTRRAAAERPTLVVSPGRMPKFRPVRGKVYEGWPIPKIDEVRRMEAAGVAVPRTEILRPGLKIDAEVWGEFVVVKPTDNASSSHGIGVQLMRSRRVRYVPPEQYPPGHPGRLGPMLVQAYVPAREVHRVLIFLGRILSHYTLTPPSEIDTNVPDDVLERTPVASQAAPSLARRFVRDADVEALALAADRALPEIPLKACDVLRDKHTRKVYVLEVNSGGNGWHFSSQHFAATRQALGLDFQLAMVQQFDAFRTAARALVARVNEEAV